MNFKKFNVFLSTLSVSVLLLTGCGKEEIESCVPSNSALVELTSDISGKSFSVGDKVALSWKVDRSRISNGQIVIDISTDNGISWSAIPSAGIVVPSDNQYQCMNYSWTIGNEGEFVEYEALNNNCILRIHEYSNNSNGVVFSQQKFTVNK